MSHSFLCFFAVLAAILAVCCLLSSLPSCNQEAAKQGPPISSHQNVPWSFLPAASKPLHKLPLFPAARRRSPCIVWPEAAPAEGGVANDVAARVLERFQRALQ